MDTAVAYRTRAAEERAKAAATALPNQRAMFERAAMTWEAMASQVDDTTERSVVNARAKAAR